MSGKTVLAKIKLLVPAGSAKPAPPVGPALGQHGLNIMTFCKDFNAKTADYKPNIPIPVLITAYADKSFTYDMKSPPVSYFLKQAAGVSSGSGKTGHETVGEITLKHIYEIAKIKYADPGQQHIPLQSHCKNIIGSCRSLGIRVLPKAEMEERLAQLQ